MDLTKIWNLNKHELITKLHTKLNTNLNNLNIRQLKLQLLRNTTFNNTVDNYIKDAFNNTMLQEDDLYRGFISINIKFSLQQIWDMTDNMIN